MMNNNKILTVSYGTFSCTLEGFDDSFGTMKAIAEYFRDLAADDRYFGAEPPQPDAEMLTRIAEREISRRVQAREHEGKIVLSATPHDAAPAAARQPEQHDAPAPAPHEPDMIATDTATADGAVLAVSDGLEANIADAMQPFAADDAHVQDNADQPRDVASRDDAHTDARTDAPEAAETDAEAPGADRVPAEVAGQTGDAAAFFAGSQDASDEDNADAVSASSTEDDVDVDVDVTATDAADEGNAPSASDAADEDEDEDDAVGIAAHVTVAAPAAPDSIAAKLQRIRAVVSQSQQEAAADELFEDEHADDMDATPGMAPAMDLVADVEDDAADKADETIANAARDIEEAQAIDDVAEDAAEDEDEGHIAAILARYDAGNADAGEIETDDADAGDIVSDIPQDDTEETTDADAGDTLGPDTLAALMAADDGQVDAGDDEGDNIFGAVEPSDSDDAEATHAPRRARILRVKRADIDAALASGQIEEVAETADEDAADPADSTLSEQEEAELMAELAAVEAELPENAAAHEASAAEVRDDDVSRLMAEADNQMEEPEGSVRRSAFAHLKAAVMAKKADAAIGEDTVKSDVPFRSDLASVVKPRRPETGGARAERPEGQRPAPLKLVAEQRVDIDAAPKGPVRPRRVAAIEDIAPEASADGAFADFAADMGAHDLPDLLEAAASYLSFVEGRDQFSRPQLMNKVRQVEKEDFSREDGLRSFGQLLRAGKIEKMKGGRFAVTDDIGYRPDHRAAG